MHKAWLYVPAVILSIGAGFVAHTRSQSALPLAAPLNTVLPVVEGFTAKDQVISAEERRVAGMSNYVARVFTDPSALTFTTLVSYYERQTQGKTIHSPRNCLPGAGWEILRSNRVSLTVDGAPHDVNHFVLRNGRQTAITYYWYQGRGRVVANEYAVKWNLLRDAAIAGHTEEALVRVVVYVPATTTADASTGPVFDSADSLGRRIAARLMHDVTAVLPSPDARSASANPTSLPPRYAVETAAPARLQ